MQHVKDSMPRRARRAVARQQASNKSNPESYDLKLLPVEAEASKGTPHPESVVLLLPDPKNPETGKLFFDQIPVPKEAWTFNSGTRTLTWKGIYGGGWLFINSNRRKESVGKVGKGSQRIHVRAVSRVRFECKAAVMSDPAIKRITNGSDVIGYEWNPESDGWKNAIWDENRLIFSYWLGFTGGTDDSFLLFSFKDSGNTDTGLCAPTFRDYGGMITLAEHNQWKLTFKGVAGPGEGSDNPDFPQSVFPYQMDALETTIGDSITGAMETEHAPDQGTLVGIEGLSPVQKIAGYYRVGNDGEIFGIFDGQLHMTRIPHPCGTLFNNVFNWSGLSAAQQSALGLPESGKMEFSKSGDRGIVLGSGLRIRRVSETAFYREFLSKNPETSTLARDVQAFDQSLKTEYELSLQDLGAMTPYREQTDQDSGISAMVDVVQQDVLADMQEVMETQLDPDIWELFCDEAQPTLTGHLTNLPSIPVEDWEGDPMGWYTFLSTAVVSNLIPQVSDKPEADQLNDLRAGNWLNHEASNSPVYKAHTDYLFRYHWDQLYDHFEDYLTDQTNTNYTVEIDKIRDLAIRDINRNVFELPGNSTGLKEDLIEQVNEAADRAINCELYWAYALYDELTDISTLTKLSQLIMMGDSDDNSDLAREIQANVTVLTALDDGDFYSGQYLETINTFIGSNVLMTLVNLDDVSAEDFDLIDEYVDKFIEQLTDSDNPALADLAAELDEMRQRDDWQDTIGEALDRVGMISSAINATWSYEYVAAEFVSQWGKYTEGTWWEGKAKKIGGVVVGGFCILSIGNLLTASADWEDLDAAQRAEVVLGGVQVGAHFMHILVGDKADLSKALRPVNFKKVHGWGSLWDNTKSGVNYVANGLTKLGRKIALILRELGALAGKAFRGALRKTKLFKSDLAAKNWTKKVFGSNMDEFLGARLGPMLTFAGFGLAIYNMTRGDTGIALAADIIELVAVSLEVFAIAGGWAIAYMGLKEGFLVMMVGAASTLSIIAAVVGFVLLLVARWLHPKDPIQIFVDDYATDAGFAMSGKCAAVDYAIPPEYDEELDAGTVEILGSYLKSGGKFLKCGTDGLLTLESGSNNLPEYVFFTDTNGWGQCRILAMALENGSDTPISMALSLMVDNSIQFAPVEADSELEDESTPPLDSNVQTQFWLTQTIGDATANGEVASAMDLQFQALLPNAEGSFLPDSDGNYLAGQEAGWLKSDGSSISYTTNSGEKATLHIQMTGLAPNYMIMNDPVVLAGGTIDNKKSWQPSFGVYPSRPLIFANLEPMPDYLEFDEQGGKYTPSGITPTEHPPMDGSITAQNTVQTSWIEQADFQFRIKGYEA